MGPQDQAATDERVALRCAEWLDGRQPAPITCDVCDVRVKADDSVWTCQGGNTTLFHGLMYDVCSDCYCKAGLADTGRARSNELEHSTLDQGAAVALCQRLAISFGPDLSAGH